MEAIITVWKGLDTDWGVEVGIGWGVEAIITVWEGLDRDCGAEVGAGSEMEVSGVTVVIMNVETGVDVCEG